MATDFQVAGLNVCHVTQILSIAGISVADNKNPAPGAGFPM